MPQLLVLHTNHGSHRFDETDIPQILHDAYFTADLEQTAEQELDFDPSEWPEQLKLSLMYTAQLSWFPGDLNEPTSWSQTPHGIQAAIDLFTDFPGLAEAISGNTGPLLSHWPIAPTVPDIFQNLGPDRIKTMVLQEIIQSQGDPDTGSNPLTFCQDPPLPHERARTIAPSLDRALADTFEDYRLPSALYHDVMDHLEELARDAAHRLPKPEKQNLLQAALDYARTNA